MFVSLQAFGFPNVIMHGMYFIARAASECQAACGPQLAYPVEVTTTFVRPVALPAKVTFAIYGRASGASELRFVVRLPSGKPALEGTFKSVVSSP
jgi:acyl dehydratase